MVSKIKKEDDISEEKKRQGSIFWYIVLATILAGILSLVLDKISEKIVAGNVIREIICIAIASVIMGILLYLIDKKMSSKKQFEELTLKDTLIIGISQALAAAFPGVSRSGITITTSRLLSYDRKGSAKLSFLLSVPIVLAAVVVSLKDFSLDNPIAFFTGILASFIVGLFVIKALMSYLEKGNYKVFAIYRILFGAVLIGITIFRMIA
jgi:undecaprenyl-diphosphatase